MGSSRGRPCSSLPHRGHSCTSDDLRRRHLVEPRGLGTQQLVRRPSPYATTSRGAALHDHGGFLTTRGRPGEAWRSRVACQDGRRAADPLRARPAPDLHRGRARARPPGPGAAAQRARGDRADRRHRGRGGPRRRAATRRRSRSAARCSARTTCCPAWPTSLTDVKVEAVFDDGTRLVVVPDPIGGGHLGDGRPGAIEVAADPDARRRTSTPSAARALDVIELDVANTADGADHASRATSTSSRSTRGCASTARRRTAGTSTSRPGRACTFEPGETVRGAARADPRRARGRSASPGSSTVRSTRRARRSARWSCCAPRASSTPARRRAADPEGAVAACARTSPQHPEVQA